MDTIWTVNLLGTLSLQRTGCGETRLKINTPHLLLARLALQLNRELGTDVLLDTFWPDADPVNARHRLSDTLTRLRKLLEPEGVPPFSVLEAGHSGVCLRAPAVITDMARLRLSLKGARQAASEDDYTKLMRIAVGLYAGELLPTVYDDWAADGDSIAVLAKEAGTTPNVLYKELRKLRAKIMKIIFENNS